MRPVYQRLPGSKMYMTGFLVLFYTGLAGVGISCANMILVRVLKTMSGIELTAEGQAG